jgi:sec-independent protein translocase protein TatA
VEVGPMMGIGFPELFVILLIIMIIFGAGKLPEIGSAFGNSIKNFKKSMKEADEIKSEAEVEQAVIEATSDGAEAEAEAPKEGEVAASPPASGQETQEK